MNKTELVDMVKRTAENIATYEEHRPFVFLGDGVVPLAQLDKPHWYSAMSMILAEAQPDYYVFIDEVWMAKMHPEDMTLNRAVKDIPGRTEHLMLVICDRDGTLYSELSEITVIDGKRHLGAWTAMSGETAINVLPNKW